MADKESVHLPLYGFFNSLREKGTELGLEEYFCFLEAIGKGFGLHHPEALYQTCKLIWYNPGDSLMQFRELFIQYWEEEKKYYSRLEEKEDIAEKEDPEKKITESKDATGKKQDTREGEKIQTQRVFDIEAEDEKDLEGFPPLAPAENIPAQSQNIQPSIFPPLPKQFRIPVDLRNLFQFGNQHSPDELEGISTQFRFVEQPFSNESDLRKIALSWRHLWQSKGSKTLNRVDIPATIDQLARQGGRIREVVYQREELFEARLMVLIDDSKSMVAFREQAEQMIGIIAQEIDSQPEKYYFSDLSRDLLFKDRAHTQSMKVSDLQRKYLRQRIPLLIISDGGAARGIYSKENVIKTYKGVEQLSKFASYMAWLNPMPRLRWKEPKPSSAWYIDQHVLPMFDFSDGEIQAAVNVLRGRNR